MIISLAAFTDRGEALAGRITEQLKKDGDTASYVRCGREMRAAEWTAARFYTDDALIFVGAAGIAVRSIAPYIESKATDPAVVVIDEAGSFAIPLLSGHLGGANALAARLASLTGGTAVITTATDVRGAFAFDDWARRMNCAVENTERIRAVSGALLAGETVTVLSDFQILGEVPSGVCMAAGGAADVRITLSDKSGLGEKRICSTDMNRESAAIYRSENSSCAALRIIPRVVCVGIGCRRGTPCSEIEKAVVRALSETAISPKALATVASIDLKADEEGIIEYARKSGVSFLTYSAAELAGIPGEFTASAFVESVTGVDNVCERAAARAAMEGNDGNDVGAGLREERFSGGEVICRKIAAGGVTVALAAREARLFWDT